MHGQGGAKVTIKKYANRRLYDTESSSYITLDRLAAMIREGRDFEVVDAKTGEDITHQVLTQIIVDEESRGIDHASGQFLAPADRPLRRADAGRGAAISRGGDGRVPEEPGRRWPAPSGPNMFADLAKRNMAMFEEAAQAMTGKKTAGGGKRKGRPTRSPSSRPSWRRCRPRSTNSGNDCVRCRGPARSERGLSKLTTITSLVYRLEPQHVVLAINAAKGGDPMSHGSAERSVQFARRVMA